MALRAGLVLALLLGILHSECQAHLADCWVWLGANVSLEPSFVEPWWNFSPPTVLEIRPKLAEHLPAVGRAGTLEHVRKNYLKGLESKDHYRLAVWSSGSNQKRMVTYTVHLEPERTRIEIAGVDAISAEACARFWRRLAVQREIEGYILRPPKPVNINDEFYYRTLHVSPSVAVKLRLGHRMTRKLIDDVVARLTVFRPSEQSTFVCFVTSRGRRFRVALTIDGGELHLKTIHVMDSVPKPVDSSPVAELVLAPN